MKDGESARRLVRASYDRLGERYATWAQGIRTSERERYTQCLLSTLPRGSRLLDLGCGDGSILTARLSAHFEVTGVDISRIQLAYARTNAPGAQFICADIPRLSLPSGSYDAVSAFYSLIHLPVNELPVTLKGIADWLRPGGILVASFGSEEHEGSVDPDWLGVPMYFSGHAPEVNCQLVREAGLVIDHQALGSDEEFNTSVTFHWIVARKASE